MTINLREQGISPAQQTEAPTGWQLNDAQRLLEELDSGTFSTFFDPQKIYYPLSHSPDPHPARVQSTR